LGELPPCLPWDSGTQQALTSAVTPMAGDVGAQAEQESSFIG